MYRRIIILSVILLATLGGLTWLGYLAIEIQSQGMEGKRWGEFAGVAEHIRSDVKRKLDEFMQKEQNRPYTDYQYYYVPENVANIQQEMPLLRSPLGDQLEHGLAYGYFQIEPDGAIITPYYKIQQSVSKEDSLQSKAEKHLANIRNNLFARLNGASQGVLKIASEKTLSKAPAPSKDYDIYSYEKYRPDDRKEEKDVVRKPQAKKSSRSRSRRGKSLPIESLQKQQQQVQVITQDRSRVVSNVLSNEMLADRSAGQAGQQREDASAQLSQRALVTETTAQVPQIGQARQEARKGISQNQGLMGPGMGPGMMGPGMGPGMRSQDRESQIQGDLRFAEGEEQAEDIESQKFPPPDMPTQSSPAETVQIRIEPFTPILVNDQGAGVGIFGGQIFMMRHLQIENRHIQQGFQLNEKKLLEEVKESAKRLMAEGMCFDLSQTEDESAAYTAILDFGFGDLVLNLMEIDPGWITSQIAKLKNWYFSIIAIVFLAVTLGLVSLWRNLHEQVKLAQKKDDFMSAVSHELRTPLTSIRMYTEMLEKNWIKSEDKRGEYYQNMRQESERLSRLIENVLDFSRIQRGRKKYHFQLGNINAAIDRAVDMMMPYARQAGFTIEKNFTPLGQIAFDSDAVMQIVINLVDNAVKYAHSDQEKKIIVRTKHDGKHVIIEVEDHGPGLAHREKKKVFDEFYRCEDEARRETTGVGLGLALVKKFALAHNGFVEILSAKPNGAIFRVGLAGQS